MISFHSLWSIFAIAALIMMVGGNARGQAAFCGTATDDFTSSGYDATALVRQHCQIGETIVIPAAYSGAVALLCDFSKSIVSTGASTMCVLAKPRPRH
jgi:hypothetical protein